MLVAGCSLGAQAQMPQAPEVAAKAWLVYDMSAQQVLASKDADTPVEPASLTKIMTAYLVFDALKAKRISGEQLVNISTLAWKQEGSRMFVEPRVPVSVNDLIKGMIVQSGNDATVALAETVSGSMDKFVELMNTQAKLMGLSKTVYKNASGLPAAGHTTTARDLMTLTQALIHDFPENYPLYSLKEFTYNKISQPNRNLLLFRDPSVDGLKTGHTDSAGFCLVATSRKPGLNGERRLISVVLGTASENARAQESQKLLNWGHASFDAVKLFDANQAAETPRVWKGNTNTIKLGTVQALLIAVPKGAAARIKTTIVRPEPLVAPFEKGAKVAVLKVTLDNQAVTEVPLVALEAVPQASMIGRAWDTLRLWLK
jgi:serine-type D-Ala-D-Ala carboxypeptidase (penicillin-binding protein 5/6)